MSEHSAEIAAGCGHPNHGASDHDCQPFTAESDTPEGVPYDRRLTESERADLRDWYDVGGNWQQRMSSLYRLVEDIMQKRLGALAHEIERRDVSVTSPGKPNQ